MFKLYPWEGMFSDEFAPLLARDRGLVGHGEIDALRLGPVSQGGVEEIDSVG